RKIVIDPAQIPALRYAEGSLATAYGKIAVTVDRNAGTLTVRIPDGIEAFRRSGEHLLPLKSGIHTYRL
ncbi:MAG: hypothetical protein IKW76_12770, partial [Clostridia bacterium]|nr:hypothetical protein [Clostridia bacterium]